jgi:hypothetical protein
MRKSLGLMVSAVLVAMGVAAAELPAGAPQSVRGKERLDIAGGVEVTTEEKAADMALPRANAPGVHLVKSDEFFRQYSDRRKAPSGLYILNSEFIPRELPDRLKAAGVTLRPDGTLVNAQGRPVTMVVWSKLVVVPGDTRPMQHTWLEELGFSPAHAAEPYPLSAWSVFYSWTIETGYCTDMRVDTNANAWGPLQGASRPPTNVQFLGTRAWAGAGTYDNWCINCSAQHTYAEVNNGCGWPGIVIASYSAAALRDGSNGWYWSGGGQP